MTGPESEQPKPVVVVVDDEPTIANAVVTRLRAEGMAAHAAYDGPGAVKMIEHVAPDAVVLDVMLPGFDGLEVCRRVQSERPVPILMLTARDDETDKIIGLGAGADDYMTKPFSMRELVARVRALLRRVQRAQEIAERSADGPSTITVGNIRIDRNQRRVKRGDTEIHLTPTEFDLLVCLALEPGNVQTREHLLHEVWDWADASGTRTVDSHIKAVRRKLGSELIRTVHGVGYALETSPVSPQ